MADPHIRATPTTAVVSVQVGLGPSRNGVPGHREERCWDLLNLAMDGYIARPSISNGGRLYVVGRAEDRPEASGTTASTVADCVRGGH